MLSNIKKKSYKFTKPDETPPPRHSNSEYLDINPKPKPKTIYQESPLVGKNYLYNIVNQNFDNVLHYEG